MNPVFPACRKQELGSLLSSVFPQIGPDGILLLDSLARLSDSENPMWAKKKLLLK